MPHAKILPYHALKTLTQLHAELAGKLSANQRETKRLRLAIFQVEAVMKMLSPEFNIRLIAPKRRNVGNPWFKRGTLARAVIDTLRLSGAHDDTGDSGRAAGRKEARGHAASSHGATGGHPRGTTGAQRDGGGWRRTAREMAVERGRQLRRPNAVS
jgi:hypothetical protein